MRAKKTAAGKLNDSGERDKAGSEKKGVSDKAVKGSKVKVH
jgi:hypothetical protein